MWKENKHLRRRYLFSPERTTKQKQQSRSDDPAQQEVFVSAEGKQAPPKEVFVFTRAYNETKTTVAERRSCAAGGFCE
ncbi:MAG: hypothetical protein ACI4E2_10250, partial [Acetatifactor sp.]